MALFPTRIVVGASGSPSSQQALEAAIELARTTSSELHLIHVKVDDPKLRGRPTPHRATRP